MFFRKWFTGKLFLFFFRKMFYYRKMVWFSVDQENIFRWPLIFHKINIRKFEKYFAVSYFQWNKRTLGEVSPGVMRGLRRKLGFAIFCLGLFKHLLCCLGPKLHINSRSTGNLTTKDMPAWSLGLWIFSKALKLWEKAGPMLSWAIVCACQHW